MGLAISRLVSILRGLKEKRLLVLGLDGSGKTSLITKLQHMNEVAPTAVPTIGFNIDQVEYNGIMMTVWDVGYQTRMRPLWPQFFPNTDALIFVLDSTDHERVEEARDMLFEVLRDPKLDDCQTVLFFVNKQDLPGADNLSTVSEKFGLNSGDEVLSRRNRHIQGCCAITGDGVYEGFDWLSQALNERG